MIAKNPKPTKNPLSRLVGKCPGKNIKTLGKDGKYSNINVRSPNTGF